MPWRSKDVPTKTSKAKSAVAKKQWTSTANAVLAKSGDDGKAIRIANAAVKKRRPPRAR